MEAFALRGLQFLLCRSSLVNSRLATENPVRVATQLGNERGVRSHLRIAVPGC